MTNKENLFSCENCFRKIKSPPLGTANRNHCPFCLWSKHLDNVTSGDRASSCQGLMKPIGLTEKQEGFDKFNRPRKGELMFIHQCQKCGKISINRIAGDDDEKMILAFFENSQKLPQKTLDKLAKENIRVIKISSQDQILAQLYGKN